jgi:hypothetical protein
MAPVLDTIEEWLLTNYATVITDLFAILGAKVLVDGITILTCGPTDLGRLHA